MTGLVHFDAGGGTGIASLTLSHPGKLNAMSVAMWRELRAHFEAVQALPGGVRVLIVAGEGGNFAAGGDIEEFPDFRFEWDVRRGAAELLDAYRAAGLTYEEFESDRFVRLRRLRRLLESGLLDDRLRWQEAEARA